MIDEEIIEEDINPLYLGCIFTAKDMHYAEDYIKENPDTMVIEYVAPPIYDPETGEEIPQPEPTEQLYQLVLIPIGIDCIFKVDRYAEAFDFVAVTERAIIVDLETGYYQIKQTPELTPEEKEAKEKERISHLKCTKRVLALALQEYGVTYTKLKELIATNEQAQLEWDLCVELERSNPLLDIMGAELGITPKQLDNIFRLANGEVIDENPTDTDTAIVPDEVQPEGN